MLTNIGIITVLHSVSCYHRTFYLCKASSRLVNQSNLIMFSFKARSLVVAGLSPAASHMQRGALFNNYPANVQVSVKWVEVIERSYPPPSPAVLWIVNVIDYGLMTALDFALHYLGLSKIHTFKTDSKNEIWTKPQKRTSFMLLHKK